ncbi:response regulator transcription factor [Cohnella fermenti]|uniref:Response regulator n=1 Tax=Cohnella fermenti TaxID=2565925 RepID=A0A4S4BQB3_9BACL|nr:response regulator [Cohnella fermenti]THF77120.1 response regulator [Cohnella fermenti]
MHSILIVDDEIEIREGLAARLSRENLGLTALYTAADGDEGLAIVEREKPDLVITDIRMNRMSGLELIRQAREKGLLIRTIVISGYDDFDLVREALQLGAADYLLKPIQTDELLKVIRRTQDELRAEWNDMELQQRMMGELRLALPRLRAETLTEWIESPYLSFKEITLSSRLAALELSWLGGGPLAILVFEVDDLNIVAEQRGNPELERRLILFGIGNVVEQTWEEQFPGRFVFYPSAGDRWVLTAECGSDEERERIVALAAESIKRINLFVKVNASAAVSPEIGRLSRLPQMYREALSLLEQKAVYGGNRLIQDLEPAEAEELPEIALQDSAAMMDLIRYGSEQELKEALRRFDRLVLSWRKGPISDVQQGLFGWLMELFQKAKGLGWKGESWLRNPILLWEQLERYNTLESLQGKTEALLLQLSREVKEQTGSRNQILKEADSYMRKHFRCNLSLTAVASEVHVTPVWLSKLFKKEMDRTFLEHLTDIRIEQAKEMLGDVKYRVYQVSQEVGYRDPVHFAKIFRKSTGLSPMEFRQMRGVDDE